MTERLNWIDDQLQTLRQQDLLRQRAIRESPPVAGMIQIDGQQYINFGSNDYLGIAASPQLVDAVNHYVGQLGWGAGASALVSGYGTLHRRLENEIAEFEGCESALLFPTGYAANVGTITSLLGKRDVVFSDLLNHASIIDGCRLSGATIEVYRHADVQHLRSRLEQDKKFRRRMIVTDGLFSMDGNIAPLVQLADLANEHDAMLMIDEAHATGVFGDHGRGTCEYLGVEDRVDLRVGTLSKALGSLGGFVAGSEKLIQWIYNRARFYMFSTAQPEVIAAASLAALRMVIEEPSRRTALLRKSEQLRKSLISMGFNTGNSCSQIIPVVVGKSSEAVRMSQSLKANGIFVPAIRPPAVPDGKSRLRISLSADHCDRQIDKLVHALKTSPA